jgi:hypothetical protein
MYLPRCLEMHMNHIILATRDVSRAEHNSADGNSCFHMGRWLQAIAAFLGVAPPHDVCLRSSPAAFAFEASAQLSSTRLFVPSVNLLVLEIDMMV